jgi:diguanylate cyclase (GGDEF)-like protein
MITVLNCIATQHEAWLTTLAALICLVGSAITLNLVRKAAKCHGAVRYGWHFLVAIASGSTVWSTHFVAMLAYEPSAPVVLLPDLTILSLVIAVVGTGIGFVVMTGGFPRFAPVIGGAMVGASIAAMHYIGMLAYRVDGLIEWNMDYFYASIVLAVLFGSLSGQVLMRLSYPTSYRLAVLTFTIAIVSLHFTGMALADKFALAVSVGGVGLLVLCTALASYLIDSHVQSSNLRQLQHIARHDSLTGLPNRTQFVERLNREKINADNGHYRIALIGIDLDRFKEVNDLYGHAAGDRLLCEISTRMTEHLESGELIGRFGGDEFAALKTFEDEDDLRSFMSRLNTALCDLVDLGNAVVRPGASLGIAIYPTDAEDVEKLLSNADMAMYRAKQSIEDKICYYESSMDEAARKRAALARDIWTAIDENQFFLNFQVQRSMKDGGVSGYEVLLRWRHPVQGLVPPTVFIPIAEESGVITQLGEWVLRAACREAASWPVARRIAVNISPLQLSHTGLVETVRDILTETGLSPKLLELEVTESAIIRDQARALHILREIKALGVSIAIDDFGTGYSSLATLRSFPFDKIKLDRSFVTDLEQNVQSKAFVRAILALGQSLDIPVLAEGVETQSQMDILQEEGCNQVQGFLLGYPAPAIQLGLNEEAEAQAA